MMNKVIVIVVYALLAGLASFLFFSRDTLTASLRAIPQPDNTTPLTAFTNCFKNGNPYRMTPWYAENILVMTDAGEKILSRRETEQHLVLFFREQPPRRFTVRHNSTSRGGKSSLLIGRYESKYEVIYRITVSVVNDEIDMLEICLE